MLKVESSVKPDWWRGIDGVPVGGGGDLSTLELPRNFMCVNRNKRGLDLDLADPAEVAVAKAVVAADHDANWASLMMTRIGTAWWSVALLMFTTMQVISYITLLVSSIFFLLETSIFK